MWIRSWFRTRSRHRPHFGSFSWQSQNCMTFSDLAVSDPNGPFPSRQSRLRKVWAGGPFLVVFDPKRLDLKFHANLWGSEKRPEMGPTPSPSNGLGLPHPIQYIQVSIWNVELTLPFNRTDYLETLATVRAKGGGIDIVNKRAPFFHVKEKIKHRGNNPFERFQLHWIVEFHIHYLIIDNSQVNYCAHIFQWLYFS